jgi:predicted ArsR family transcriptional regulator
MTQSDRILKVLKSGKRFTSSQLAGLVATSPDAVRSQISKLRGEGYAVYSDTRKSDGKTFYRLGTPSRAMVAQAYAVFGTEAFGA